MTNPSDEPINTGRGKTYLILLLFFIVLYIVFVIDFFNRPVEEPEGIIVRFILFFKQSILI